MVVVNIYQGVKSLSVRGSLGRPNGMGLMKMGWSKPGDFFPEAGVYQKRTRFGKRQIVKMRHTRVPNPRTSRQQFFRDYFRYSVAIYHSLSENALAFYNTRAKKYQMTGYNYYISEYTNVKPAHVGNFRLGFTKPGQKMYFESPSAPAPIPRYIPFDLGMLGS